MAGFLKRVAGAFIYLDEKGGKPNVSSDSAVAGGGDQSLNEIGRDASELIAQLGGAGRSGTPSPASPSISAAGAGASAENASGTVADMTADAVFVAAGIPDGPSSAQRVLRIIAGLSMFPKEQQVLMVRAMDSADDAWSEKEVLEDARRRQSALRSHLQAIDSERAGKLQTIATRIEKTQADGKRRLDEIDQQLAEIQKLREEAVALTSSSLNELEQAKKQAEESSEKARRGITSVVNLLSDLITFFMGGEARPASKS